LGFPEILAAPMDQTRPASPPAQPVAYPVEIAAPDIARWAEGNGGLPYLHSFEARAPGPHVAITALVHGNEICGAIALDRLLRDGLRPARGRLSLAFVNVAAYECFVHDNPKASRYVDEDFNRLWSPARLEGPGDSAELSRARELRPFIDTVDVLLDLHSMQHPAEPLALCGPLAKGRALAARVAVPATVVADRGHAAGARLRDYGGFGDPASPKNALLVECGQHWARGCDAVAVEVCLRFLLATGALGAAEAAPYGLANTLPPQSIIEVTDAITVRHEDFAFAASYRGMERIAEAGTVIARDGDAEIVTPYADCILIMPSERLRPGQTAVRLGRLVA